MSTVTAIRRCLVCGTEVPRPFRKCDTCIIGPDRTRRLDRVVEVTDTGQGLIAVERDVVLACGHVIASRVRSGGEVRCPLHRREARVLRAHDGIEVPVILP